MFTCCKNFCCTSPPIPATIVPIGAHHDSDVDDAEVEAADEQVAPVVVQPVRQAPVVAQAVRQIGTRARLAQIRQAQRQRAQIPQPESAQANENVQLDGAAIFNNRTLETVENGFETIPLTFVDPLKV